MIVDNPHRISVIRVKFVGGGLLDDGRVREIYFTPAYGELTQLDLSPPRTINAIFGIGQVALDNQQYAFSCFDIDGIANYELVHI